MVLGSTLTTVRITEVIVWIEFLLNFHDFLFILFKKLFLRMHTHMIDLLLKPLNLFITSELFFTFHLTFLTLSWELHFIAAFFYKVFNVLLLFLFFLLFIISQFLITKLLVLLSVFKVLVKALPILFAFFANRLIILRLCDTVLTAIVVNGVGW